MFQPHRKLFKGKRKRVLDEILEKINERYKGDFTDADRVMLTTLHEKLSRDEKLASSAKTTDPLFL